MEISTEDLLSATLWTAGGGNAELSAVVDQLAGSGQRLNRQVEVAVAVRKLVEQGLVQHETAGDGERLTLTEEGRDRAEYVADELADRQIEVVEEGRRQELTISAAAERFDRSPVGIVADCSADGVYYHEDRVEDTDIVGREGEQAQFEEILDRVRQSGDGEVVRLVGASGSGKTALVDAMAAETPAGVSVFQTSSVPAETEAYQPIRSLFDQIGTDDVLSSPAFEVADPDSYEAQQTGLFTDFTERLTPESGTRVLVFDDINHADAGTWQYLGVLCQQLADRPLVVVLVHRPGTLPEDAPIHPSGAFEETCIELTGLARDGTRKLIEQVLGRRGVPEAFVDAVHDRTGGAPLFVETTVETLRETDQVDPQLQMYPTAADEFELPAEVTETIQRQATFLESDVREVLEWVAVASGFVPVSLVQRAAACAPERVATILETVTQMGLLGQETRDGEREVSFRNEVFGDALAAGLSDAERERYHGTIARLLEERGGETPDTGSQPTADRAAIIAFHYERSGDRTSAIEWYERAADRATDVYAHETAIDYYYRVIDLARDIDDRDRVLSANERLAEIYIVTGEYDQAEKHVQFVRERIGENDTDRVQRLARRRARIYNAQGEFDDAIDVATAALDETDSVEQCRLLGTIAEAHHGQSNFEQMRETAKRQCELAATLGDPALEAEALNRLGLAARRQSAFDQAREYYEESLAINEEIGDRRGKADSLRGIGITAWNQSELEAAHEYSAESLEIQQDIGDRQGEAKTLLNLGTIAWMRGNPDQSHAYLEACLEISRDIGDRPHMSKVLTNLGNIANKQGNHDQASEYYEESLEIAREIGDRDGVASALHNLGSVAQSSGLHEQAREYYEESLEISREIGASKSSAELLANLGLIAIKQGRYDRAREVTEESLTKTEEIGDYQTKITSLNTLGNLARQRGEFDRAREYYEESLELTEEYGLAPFQPEVCRGLCVTALDQDHIDPAAEYAERALTVSEETGARSDVAGAHLADGRVALARGDLTTARERVESALGTYREIGHPYWQARSRRILGAIEREDGEMAATREQFTAAVELFEDIGAGPDTLQTLELLVETCREQGDTDEVERLCRRAREVRADTPDQAAEHHGGWIEACPEDREP